jgi:transposase
MKTSITPIGTPVGVDVHKRRCKVVELNRGEIKVRKPMANAREEWLEMLTELPPDAEIGLEVSTAGYFAMSVLEEAGWRERTHWVHTAGIDSNRRQKNDRLDAERLARKLAAHHLDPLPEAWFPPPEIRALRLRARARCWLALLRTQCKNHLQSLLQMHGLLLPGSDPLGAAGQKWLAQQTLPLPLTESIPQIQRLLKLLEEEIAISEKYLQAVEAQFPELALLRTIPGIGAILAPVIWSEIGKIERFRSAKALANDTGLVASFYDSGEVKVSGPITRQGSRWLRWAFVTAANVAIQYRNPFARRYHRLRRGKKPNVAKAAIAHSLARCVYGVLKHGCPYREDRWGRKVGALEQEARGSQRSTKTVP